MKKILILTTVILTVFALSSKVLADSADPATPTFDLSEDKKDTSDDAIKVDAGGQDAVKKVKMDKGLERVLYSSIHKGEQITSETDTSLTVKELKDYNNTFKGYIKANARGISDLNGLQYLTNLKSVELANNNLNNSDLTILAGLTNLKEIDLRNNHISDISALKGVDAVLATGQTITVAIDRQEDYQKDEIIFSFVGFDGKPIKSISPKPKDFKKIDELEKFDVMQAVYKDSFNGSSQANLKHAFAGTYIVTVNGKVLHTSEVTPAKPVKDDTTAPETNDEQKLVHTGVSSSLIPFMGVAGSLVALRVVLRKMHIM